MWKEGGKEREGAKQAGRARGDKKEIGAQENGEAEVRVRKGGPRVDSVDCCGFVDDERRERAIRRSVAVRGDERRIEKEGSSRSGAGGPSSVCWWLFPIVESGESEDGRR